MGDEKDEKKKDLTGILELSSLMPPASAEELLAEDPFQVNVEQSIEHVDDFMNLSDMGMLDHAREAPAENPVDFAHEDAFAIQTPNEEIANTELAEESSHDLSLGLSPDLSDAPASVRDVIDDSFNPLADSELDLASSTLSSLPLDPLADPPSVEDVKTYSERSRETPFKTQQKVSFHLWMTGKVDPFARDKLLLFINDNPIGLNSMELDRQINAGRIMFPRISEFAGIKLIQELRDGELNFKLTPSPRDDDEVLPEAENVRISFDSKESKLNEPSIAVLPNNIDLKLWRAFDQIQIVQFLKVEILDVERSELFQNLMDRMLISLKRKAELKGAGAIGEVNHELKPLRLPSQYQVELKGTLYKKL